MHRGRGAWILHCYVRSAGLDRRPATAAVPLPATTRPPRPSTTPMVHRLSLPLPPAGLARYAVLGGQLRAARLAQPGLSVALLAAVVAVTPATIYQYEAGHHRPQRTTLRRLATVLNLDRHALAALAGYP